MEVVLYDVSKHDEVNRYVDMIIDNPTLEYSTIMPLIKIIRSNGGLYSISSNDTDKIKRVYMDLMTYMPNIQMIALTEFDIIVPKNNGVKEAIDHVLRIENFKDLGVNETDVLHNRLRTVVLMTSDEFNKKYGSRRLTDFATGSTYYMSALRAQENLNTHGQCIVCSGSFDEIQRIMDICNEKHLPTGRVNLDVLCIAPSSHIEYIYRLILGGKIIGM